MRGADLQRGSLVYGEIQPGEVEMVWEGKMELGMRMKLGLRR